MPADMVQRLVSASHQAYAISGDGPAPIRERGMVPPAHDCIGYTKPSVACETGLHGQDAGLVGAIPEGVLIALRGTTSLYDKANPYKALVDWACDCLASLETPPGQPPGFPGKVHFGFWKAFMGLWSELNPLVQAAVKAHPQKRIYVTGHSKGGSVAALAAWRLKQDYPNHQIIVRTFAAPRVGDDAFARAYNAVIDHVRFEYGEDVVPHLPLRTALVEALGAPPLVAKLLSAVNPGYGEAGRLRYIYREGAMTDQTPTLDQERFSRLFAKLSSRQDADYQYVGECHVLETGYLRYARGN